MRNRSQCFVFAIAMFVVTSIVGAQVPQRNLKPADNRKAATAVKQTSEARNFSYADKVTILFHGLMVGRFNADPKRLEVGIVKDAPDHKFEVKVRDEDGNFQTFNSTEKYWTFEVQDKTGKLVSSFLSPYQPNPNFDRMAPIDARYREDFRYVADMEGAGFYNTPLERKAGAFSRIFHIANGSVRSKCLMPPLQNRKGDGEWQDYGRMAEIIGVDIELKPEQSLVLKVSNANQPQREVWRWTYQSGRTAETAVLNIPSEHHPLPAETDQIGKARTVKTASYHGEASWYLAQACISEDEVTSLPLNDEPTHFSYYNKLIFKKESSESYDIRLQRQKAKMEKIIYSRAMTVTPYLCGMVFLSKSTKSLD